MLLFAINAHIIFLETRGEFFSRLQVFQTSTYLEVSVLFLEEDHHAFHFSQVEHMAFFKKGQK